MICPRCNNMEAYKSRESLYGDDSRHLGLHMVSFHIDKTTQPNRY